MTSALPLHGKKLFSAPRFSCDMCELGIIKIIKLWTPLTGTSKAHVGMETLQMHKSTLQDSGNCCTEKKNKRCKCVFSSCCSRHGCT